MLTAVAATDLAIETTGAIQDVQKDSLARPQGAKRRSVDCFHQPIACVNRRLPRPYGEPLSEAPASQSRFGKAGNAAGGFFPHPARFSLRPASTETSRLS